MADLVRGLARALGQPVLDDTGFTGDFDIDLNYTDEDVLKSPGSAAPDNASGSQLPDGPTCVFSSGFDSVGPEELADMRRKRVLALNESTKIFFGEK